MECLKGGSLEGYVEGLGSLTLEEAAAICHQVSRALVHIHDQGFSHNDVKPSNVLFRRPLKKGKGFDPVLIDFGVAVKLVRHQTDGSVVYMAPERLREAREPNPPEQVAAQDLTKADVWSMGIMFYRLLVGREPFLGITDRSITSAILRAVPESILRKCRDVPREVDRFVIEGCLAKEPRLRVSMGQLHSFMEAYAGGMRVQRAPKKRGFLWW
jgi:serine/threonine-protein kinase